jgi:hypothetical protein
VPNPAGASSYVHRVRPEVAPAWISYEWTVTFMNCRESICSISLIIHSFDISAHLCSHVIAMSEEPYDRLRIGLI